MCQGPSSSQVSPRNKTTNGFETAIGTRWLFLTSLSEVRIILRVPFHRPCDVVDASLKECLCPTPASSMRNGNRSHGIMVANRV